MKLEINSTVIPSPLTPELFLCKEVRITGEGGKVLYVNLLSDRDDLPKLTNTKPNELGEWLATIYEAEGGEQIHGMYIGCELVNNNTWAREHREYTNTRALEGISESDAVRKVIEMTFDKLIMPMIQPAYAGVVRTDLMEHAHWMLCSGMLHLPDGGEYKVTRGTHSNITLSRIYRVTNQCLAVKQTLVTAQAMAGFRQTKLYKGGEHRFATMEQLKEQVYDYNAPQPMGFDTTPVTHHYEDMEIKHPYVLQQVTTFAQSGYSKEFIKLFITESNALLERQANKTGQPQTTPFQAHMMQQFHYPNGPMLQASGVPINQIMSGYPINSNGPMAGGVASEIMTAHQESMSNPQISGLAQAGFVNSKF